MSSRRVKRKSMSMTAGSISRMNVVDNESITMVQMVNACASIFDNLGWEVMTRCKIQVGNISFRPDIALFEKGNLKGYAEVIFFSGKEYVQAKKRKIEAILGTRPEVVFVTDGNMFDVYWQGRHIGSRPAPFSLKGWNSFRNISSELGRSAENNTLKYAEKA